MPEMSSGHLLDRLNIGVPRHLFVIALHLAVCSALVLKTNHDAPSNRVDLFDNVDDDGPAAAKKWSSTMYTSEFFPSTSSILRMSQPPADHFDDLQRLEPVFPHFGKRRERPVSRNTNVLQKRWGLPPSVVSKQKLRRTYDSARPLHGRQFPMFGGLPPPPPPFTGGIDMFNSFFSPSNYYDNNVGFNRPRQFAPSNAFAGPPQYANVADYDEHAPQAQNAGFIQQVPHNVATPVRVDVSRPPKSLNIPPAPPLHEQAIPPHQQVAVHKNPLARPPVVFPTAHLGGGFNVEPLPFQVPTRPHDVDDLTRYFEVQPNSFNNQPFSSPLVNANNPPIQNAPHLVRSFHRPPQQKEFRLPPPVFPQHVPIQPTTNNANAVHVHPPAPISTSLGPPPIEQGFPVNAHSFNPPTPSLFAVPAQKPPLPSHQPQRLFVDSHKIHPVSVIGAPPTRQTIDTILHNSLPPIPPSHHPSHHEQQLINVFNPINPIANVPRPRPPPPPLATNSHFQLQQPRPFPFTQSAAAFTTTTSTTTTSTTPQPVVSAVKYNPSSYTPPNLSKILPSDNVMFDKNGRIKKPYGPAFNTALLSKPVSGFGTEFQRVSAAVPDGNSPAAVINNIPNDQQQQQHGNSPNVYVTNQILYGELPSLAALGFARLGQQQQQSSTSSESTPQIFSVNYANTASTTTSSPSTTFSPQTIQVNEPVASTAEPNNFNRFVPPTVLPLPHTSAVFFASKPNLQSQNGATINIEPVEPPQNLNSIGQLLQHIPDPGQHVGAIFNPPPPQNYYQSPPPQQWTVKNLPSLSTAFAQPPLLPVSPHNTEQQPILQHIPDQSVASAPRPLPPPPNGEFYDGNVPPNDQFSSSHQSPSYNDNFNQNFPPPPPNGADFFVDNNDNFIDPTKFVPPFLGRKSTSKSLATNFERSPRTQFNKNLDQQYSALVSYANRVDSKNHNEKVVDAQWSPANKNKSYSRRYQSTESPLSPARNTLLEVPTTISSPALPFNLYSDDDGQRKISDQQQQSSFGKKQQLNYGYASRGFLNSVDQTRTQPKATINTYFSPRAAAGVTTAHAKAKQRVVFVDVNTNVVELSQNTACLDGEGIYPLPGTCARYYYCTSQEQTSENPLRKYRVFELVCPADMVFDINEDGCVENSKTRQLLCKFFGASVQDSNEPSLSY